MVKTEVVKARVDSDLLDRMDLLIETDGSGELNRSIIIREALRRYLQTQSTPDLALLSTLGEFVDVQSEA